MKEKSNVIKWLSAIAIGLLIVTSISGVGLYFLVSSYEKKVARENEQVSSYAETTANEETSGTESVSSETLNYGIDVEEIESSTEESEIEYWEENADKSQVYFKDSTLITESGFLPYDILGPLTDYLTKELNKLGDASREMGIDDTLKNDNLSVIYFHTDKGKYTYRYYWDTKVQELLEDN